MRDDQRETHVGADSVDALRQQRDRLRMQLDTARHDLHQAQFELAQAREIQEELQEQVSAAGSAAFTQPVVAPTRKQRRAWITTLKQRVTLPTSERALQPDLQLLRDSAWFDADWYLAEYPDVAQAGLDPVRHYLVFGAAEGRNPGPSFSTSAYIREHYELAGSRTNPLVHFLRSGRGAGK